MGSDAIQKPGRHKHLRNWGDGKLRGIGLLGIEAATAASACHELLEQSRRRSGPIWKLQEPDDQTWFRLYRSRRSVRRGLCEAFGCVPDDARVIDALFGGLAWCSSAERGVVNNTIAEVLSGVDVATFFGKTAEFWQALLLDINEIDQLDDQSKQVEILRHPAMVFFLQVAAPIWLRHGEWPQTLIIRATASNNPDMKALDWLVRNDRRARRHPAIKRAIAVASPKVAKEFRKTIERAEKGSPRKVNRATLETRLCGLISEMSIRMGAPLEAREIRKLFDQVAQHESGSLRNFNLHHYAGTFRREVNRARKHWLRSLPTMQAFESIKCVRTLMDRAFYYVGHDTARTISI